MFHVELKSMAALKQRIRYTKLVNTIAISPGAILIYLPYAIAFVVNERTLVERETSFFWYSNQLVKALRVTVKPHRYRRISLCTENLVWTKINIYTVVCLYICIYVRVENLSENCVVAAGKRSRQFWNALPSQFRSFPFLPFLASSFWSTRCGIQVERNSSFRA